MSLSLALAILLSHEAEALPHSRCGRALATVGLTCLLAGGCANRAIHSRETIEMNAAPKPHIALIGDSISTPFYRGDSAHTVFELLNLDAEDLFLANNGESEPYSVFERLRDKGKAARLSNLSRPGAFVFLEEPANTPPAWLRSWLYIPRLSEQVSRLNELPSPPDSVIVWMGHNDVLYWSEYAKALNLIQESQADEFVQIAAREFEENYSASLDRVYEFLKSQKRPASIGIVTLVNFRSLIDAKDLAERIRAAEPSLFPFFHHLRDIPGLLVGFRPATEVERREHRDYVILSLFDHYNRSMERVAERLRRKAEADGAPIQVYFETSPSHLYVSVEDLALDGTHPNDHGRSKLADSIDAIVQRIFDDQMNR